MAENLHFEEEFYRENGWPTEEYSLCGYKLPVLGEDAKESDYDQFALITNAVYPYIRLTKRRGNSHIPCGSALSPATDGWFAGKLEPERDTWCPKIAWGFAAVFLANLKYDSDQKDYVLLKDAGELIRGYYNKYLTMYLQCHNGLKYKSLPVEQKELNFIEEHEGVVKSLWEKSVPLKAYSKLYGYASEAEADYECFLLKRKNAIIYKKEGKPDPSNTNDMGERRIINQNGGKSVYVENNTGTIIMRGETPDKREFCTGIRETFGKSYIPHSVDKTEIHLDSVIEEIHATDGYWMGKRRHVFSATVSLGFVFDIICALIESKDSVKVADFLFELSCYIESKHGLRMRLTLFPEDVVWIERELIKRDLVLIKQTRKGVVLSLTDLGKQISIERRIERNITR